MDQSVYIISKSAICHLGHDHNLIQENFKTSEVNCSKLGNDWIYPLHEKANQGIQAFLNEHYKYKKLDPSVQFAIYTSHQALLDSGYTDDHIGINIGSSRGATSIFEADHKYFIEKGKSKLLSSPLTTLGNISSNVAKHLELQGPCISHSITCSTALQSITNAYAWIKSGLCDHFIVGGSEAPNTPFTIEQMKALKIYTNEEDQYPCKPLGSENKTNQLSLGEGAASFLMSKNKDKAIAKISGIGYQLDTESSLTGIPEDGANLYESMKMAVKNHDKEIDLIFCHAPGTLNGDEAELKAIKNLFPDKSPHIFSTKHLTGHSLGASGALSLYLALICLEEQFYPEFPYNSPNLNSNKKNIQSILINAVGFGGNASSILIEKVD